MHRSGSEQCTVLKFEILVDLLFFLRLKYWEFRIDFLQNSRSHKYLHQDIFLKLLNIIFDFFLKLHVNLEPFGHSGGTREKRAMSRDSGTWRVTHLSCVDGSNPIHGDGAHTLPTVVPTCTSEPPAGQPKGLIEPVNKTVSNPDKKYHAGRTPIVLVPCHPYATKFQRSLSALDVMAV
jgi:hypothetical protein